MALINSLRQLGAAMGVAVPAAAFELVAGGSRSAEAALAGSTGAFVVSLAVLAIPLGLALLRYRPRQTAAPARRLGPEGGSRGFQRAARCGQ